MKEKLTIVKVGGAVVEDDAQLEQLLNDFSAIEGRKVLALRHRWWADAASRMPICWRW